MVQRQIWILEPMKNFLTKIWGKVTLLLWDEYIRQLSKKNVGLNITEKMLKQYPILQMKLLGVLTTLPRRKKQILLLLSLAEQRENIRTSFTMKLLEL